MTESNGCNNCQEKEKKIQIQAEHIRELTRQFKEMSGIAKRLSKLCGCSNICFPTIDLLKTFNHQLKEYKGANWKTLVIFQNIILNIEKEKKKDKLCDEHRKFLENDIEKNTKWYNENC